ncbi:hypothetical protein [Streptococcus salivarius]
MKLKNISSRVLRSFRTITAALAVFLISISISLYKSKTSPEIWLAVGALALVVIFVNGLLCRMLKKRPDSVNPTIRQSFIVFLVISLLVLCVEFYTLLTFSDTTDRIVLAVLMLLLILCDFLAYLQVKNYFKQ